MRLVYLQDEMASGERRDVFDVFYECAKRGKASNDQRKFRKVIPELDQQYQRELQNFIWARKPHYFITLNFNFPNGFVRQGKQKYSKQRPRPDWLKNLVAVLESRIVKRRANRLPEHMRLSIVAFPEFTTTENLHYHLLLWMPDQNRYSKSRLTKEQVDAEIRGIIEEVLEHFFPRASVDVQAVWSKDAVTYATKCVNRSSEIDWNYWRKQSPKQDAVPLNTSRQLPIGNDDADSNDSISGLRHSVEGASCIPPATGIVESERAVGRRQAVPADHSASTLVALGNPRKSNPTWRFNLRGYSFRSVIAAVVATARDWLRMPVADG